MSIDLTNGPVTKKMMLFSLPLIAGNLLQQTYNIADTVIEEGFSEQMLWRQWDPHMH